MRLSLRQKFVLASAVVAVLAVGVATVLEHLGLGAAAWLAPLLALAASTGLATLLFREVGQGAQRLARVAERVRQGELPGAPPLPEAPRLPDESHDLAVATAVLLQGLQELAVKVRETAERLGVSTAELTRCVDGVALGNEEISTTVGSLSRSSAQQLELLQGVTRLTHDIASAIELNSSRAREAFGFAAEANQKANSGVDISRLAIEKMRSVFERVEQSGAMVFQLEAKTRHVHQITEIITSVASRTNLLSLNASIEAARAGEAGRGFAVVADEIRKLAESAARSADEISKLIHEIEADTQSVADEMRQSGQVITEGREDVNTIAHSLEQIRAAVGEAAGRAEEIFQEADNQAGDAERMVRSMDEITRVAQGNASAVDEVAATAQRQLDAMAEMVGSSKELMALSSEFEGTVRRLRGPEAEAAGEAEA